MADITRFTQGDVFEKKLFQALLTDETFAMQMADVFDVEYLNLKYLQCLAKTYYSYYEKYNTFPSLEMLQNIIQNLLKNEGVQQVIKEDIFSYFQEISRIPLNGDLKYIEEEALDFCKRQALLKAIQEVMPEIQKSNFGSISSKIAKALTLGEGRNLGHRYWDEKEKRWQIEAREFIPTPWKEINEVFRGGIVRRKLLTIVSSSGGGKTSCLTNITAGAIENGYNAIYYTLELSEQEIGRAFDSYFLELPVNDLIAIGEEELSKQMAQYRQDKNLGTLFVKELPMKACSVNTIKAHLKKLEQNHGFIPDLIAIDYADYLRPAGKIEGRVDEILQAIYEELKGLSQETARGIAVITASQTNRTGMGQEIIGMEAVAGSFGKFMPCDVVLTVARTIEDQTNKGGRIYIAKSRIGGMGKIFEFFFDHEKDLKVRIIGEANQPVKLSEAEETEIIQKKLQEKFKLFQLEQIVKRKGENN